MSTETKGTLDMFVGTGGEQWRDTLVSPNYQVSTMGRVRSKTREVKHGKNGRRTLPGRILKGSEQKYGHVCYALRVDGKNVYRFGHQLVMAAFVGPPGEGQEVLHANGIAQDNRLTNLRYGTRLQNGHDRAFHRKHGRGVKRTGMPVFITRPESRALRSIARRLPKQDADVILSLLGRMGSSTTASP